MTVTISRKTVVAVLGAVVAVGLLLVVGRQAWAGVDDPPLPTVAFVARADNPVDALAASSMAGQLGAPVFLTFPDQLHPDASAGLANVDPDTVVLAGGTAALSQTVEDQVAALLPQATIIRKAGATRTSTATALAGLPAELGFTRPVLTGAAVPGDAAIDGELTVGSTEVAATLQVLTDRVTALEAELAGANDRVAALEATLAGVSRTGDELVFSGMNVRVDNGSGTTAGEPNGLGNLIVGYNEDDPEVAGEAVRSGSHNLVIGTEHTYTSFGGIVAGFLNTISGEWASVTGGLGNMASGSGSSVTGGSLNIASGRRAAVTGGGSNEASNDNSAVTGGVGNTASGRFAAVSGGASNVASGSEAAVSGGGENEATGRLTTVLGGYREMVSDELDSVVGHGHHFEDDWALF